MLKSLTALIFLAICPLLPGQQRQSGPATTTDQNFIPPQTPTRSAAAATPNQPPPPDTLLDGTPVKLRLTETISSANIKAGQEIPFEVVEDVSLNHVIVLPKGATAIATVTEAEHKKSLGRGGKLNISISYARLKDQEKVALRAAQNNQGGGHIAVMTTAMVATGIVFFPVAPLFLFIHGKDVAIPQGTEVTAFVQGDMHLNMAYFEAAPAASVDPTPSAAVQASLVIESVPPGADVEIDGVFVGSTPSTVSIAPGSRRISVRKKGFADWTRTLDVSGGTIHLNAELEQEQKEQ